MLENFKCKMSISHASQGHKDRATTAENPENPAEPLQNLAEPRRTLLEIPTEALKIPSEKQFVWRAYGGLCPSDGDPRQRH